MKTGIKVNEIFYNIQGESLYAGLPCTFVRLSGCNLRCVYCDTRYAYEEGAWMPINDIIKAVAAYPCRLVEITGGEPLFQEQTPDLISTLIENGYTLLLETNGSMDIRPVDPRCIKIIDVKCPGSGESEKNNFKNLKHLSAHDQIKFVITNKNDYEFAKNILATTWPESCPVPVLFSPAYNIMEPAVLADWILKDGLDARLHLQLHKIVWPDIERGK
jgi:7-carboxy-7-deazaguanine synthase